MWRPVGIHLTAGRGPRGRHLSRCWRAGLMKTKARVPRRSRSLYTFPRWRAGSWQLNRFREQEVTLVLFPLFQGICTHPKEKHPEMSTKLVRHGRVVALESGTRVPLPVVIPCDLELVVSPPWSSVFSSVKRDVTLPTSRTCCGEYVQKKKAPSSGPGS